MTAPIRDEFLEIHGLRLHFLQGGRADGPPLLMVHGLTREAHAFDPVLAQLGGRYRCLALDVRGRGGSAWGAPEGYAITQYAADVQAFLDALGLGAVHYLGTSMGGLIAMTLAAQEPERFLSLALNDIGPEVATGGSGRIQTHLANVPASFDSYEAAIAYETNRYPWLATRPQEVVDAQYRHMLVREPDGRCRFHYDPHIRGGRAVTDAARQEQRERCWQGFQALACPLLLIRGAESDLLAMETVERMREAQPGLQVVQVPGVGHAPALVEPEAVAALDAFFPG